MQNMPKMLFYFFLLFYVNEYYQTFENVQEKKQLFLLVCRGTDIKRFEDVPKKAIFSLHKY
jgi:hypothetical protein